MEKMQLRDFTTNSGDKILEESSLSLPQKAFVHLRQILSDHLTKHPKLTLNGISKRCAVSEPTLRRINKGQCKRIPNASTVISLLSYISKEDDVIKIIALYKGPLAEFIREKVPSTNFSEMKTLEMPTDLGGSLDDPVKYLIYKLAANSTGVTKEKVVELFGPYGERQLEVLIGKNLIECQEDICYGKYKHFSLPFESIVQNFKATADFIKTEKVSNSAKNLSPLVSNYSRTINKKAYSEILKVQRAAQKKIIGILSSEKSEGEIPTFVLMATDTIDVKIADEF